MKSENSPCSLWHHISKFLTHSAIKSQKQATVKLVVLKKVIDQLVSGDLLLDGSFGNQVEAVQFDCPNKA